MACTGRRTTAIQATILAPAFMLAGALAAQACDWGRPLPDHAVPAFAWELIEDGAGIPANELLNVAGRIAVAPAAAGGTPDDRLCVHLETTLTCSLGIAVCAFLVIGAEPGRDLELIADGHEMAALQAADGGQPVIVLRTYRADEIEESRFIWRQGGYIEE